MMNDQGISAKTQQLQVRLQGITDYIRDCERRVNLGEVVDMRGLDANVADICKDVQSLPQQEGQTLEQSMLKLIDSLDVLAKTFQDIQQVASSGGTTQD
jgi:hypothetical protein